MKNEILINLRGKTPRFAVAKALRITPQGLGMIERGERIPRPNLMKHIANYYAKTVDELFFTTLDTKCAKQLIKSLLGRKMDENKLPYIEQLKGVRHNSSQAS